MERLLPSKYKNQLRKIDIPGVVGLSWDRSLLLDFLNSEECLHFAVMGGDVLRLVDQKMEYTYDNWSVSGRRHPAENFADYVTRCKKQAIDYITSYPLKEGVFFTIALSSEVTAGL
jgi:hypothetical protein